MPIRNPVRRRLLAALATVFPALLSSGMPVAQAADTDDVIVISGASGQLGSLVVRDLLKRGVPAKNLILVSRTPDKLAEFKELGAVTRHGDFTKPETLKDAFAGGDTLLLISIGFDAGPRPKMHCNAIDAAKDVGIKRIVYTSFVAISQGDHSGLAGDHHATEELIKASGLAWTMLRNSIYANGLVQQAAKMLKDGKAEVSEGDTRIGYVTREDCAAAAAAVLATSGHENKAYDITGPELIGPREIAAAASAVSGKTITLEERKDPARRGFGGPSIAVVSEDFAKLTGRPATSLRALLEANKDALMAPK